MLLLETPELQPGGICPSILRRSVPLRGCGALDAHARLQTQATPPEMSATRDTTPTGMLTRLFSGRSEIRHGRM